MEIREDSDSEPDAVMRSSLPRPAKERLFLEESLATIHRRHQEVKIWTRKLVTQVL
jgi:hypothetical protein